MGLLGSWHRHGVICIEHYCSSVALYARFSLIKFLTNVLKEIGSEGLSSKRMLLATQLDVGA